MKNGHSGFPPFPSAFYPDKLIFLETARLTPRQIDIISCLVSGKTSRETAAILSIAEKTLETHKTRLFRTLDCHCQQEIISFVERTDRYEAFREHYQELSRKLEIENGLVNISSKVRQGKPILIKTIPQNIKDPFLDFLLEHLQLAGFQVLKDPEVSGSYDIWKLQTHIAYNPPTTDKHTIMIKIGCNRDGHGKTGELMEGLVVNLTDAQEYFHSLLKVLQIIIPGGESESLSHIIANKRPETNNTTAKPLPLRVSLPLKKKKMNYGLGWLVAGALTCLYLVITNHHVFRESSFPPSRTRKLFPVHCDLPLPRERALLHRPVLFAEVVKRMGNTEEGIREIALTGPGGSGKTTLARYYARSRCTGMVWEINAETPESMRCSFESLADALAHTGEDKALLKQLKDIKHDQDRAGKILEFVRQRLVRHPGWILIYDNVEEFADIKTHFPYDPAIWGNGKVILTTRNSNIQNCPYINTCMTVPELNPEERMTLFLKAYRGRNDGPELSTKERRTLEIFLQRVPPFPLDVTLSARYLRNTRTGYDDYLDALYGNDDRITSAHEEILLSDNHYNRTRYSIIKLSIDEMLRKNPEYKDLLILLTLIDSQSMPKFLFEDYAKSGIVNNFIRDLHRYSLITYDPQQRELATFSIHRSTQEMMRAYLTKKLDLNINDKCLGNIALFLEKYIYSLRLAEDFTKIRFIVPHGDMLLKRSSFLTQTQQAFLGCELAGLYLLLNRYSKSREILDKSQLILEKEKDFNLNPLHLHSKKARILVYKGMTERFMGNYENAIKLTKKGLEIYKTFFPDDLASASFALEHLASALLSSGNYAEGMRISEESVALARKYSPDTSPAMVITLITSGRAWTEVGSFEKARLALEESMNILANKFPGQYPRLLSWTLGSLGRVSHACGQHARAYELIRKAHNIYEELLSDNYDDIAWFSIHLGVLLTEQGEYEKAEALLKEALIQCKNLSPSHFQNYLVKYHLGNLYAASGRIELAKTLLDETLEHCRKFYGPKHIETARALGSLGKLALSERKIDKAEDFLKESLSIFEARNHPEIYKIYRLMADLMLLKALNQKDAGKSGVFQKQAVDYLKQGSNITRSAFGEKSHHYQCITARIRQLEKKISKSIL